MVEPAEPITNEQEKDNTTTHSLRASEGERPTTLPELSVSLNGEERTARSADLRPASARSAMPHAKTEAAPGRGKASPLPPLAAAAAALLQACTVRCSLSIGSLDALSTSRGALPVSLPPPPSLTLFQSLRVLYLYMRWPRGRLALVYISRLALKMFRQQRQQFVECTCTCIYSLGNEGISMLK